MEDLTMTEVAIVFGYIYGMVLIAIFVNQQEKNK